MIRKATTKRVAKAKAKPAAARSFGRFIVADPLVCHGRPTFRGTRIFVSDVLHQVARGMDWDEIVGAWRGKVPKEAIAEAVELSRQALLDHLDEYSMRPAAT